jgi:hypothetical protein
MKQFALPWRSAAAMSLMSLLSCGGDLTLPKASAAGLDLVVVRGNDQTGTVGQALPDPVVVQVSTDEGTPMAGSLVAFVVAVGQDAGAFDPDTVVTDSQGQAPTRWMLGTAPGVYSGEARIVAAGDTVVPSVPIQASAVAADPDTLRALSPASQLGRRNGALEEPLVVIALDRFGNPVEGAEVKWKATAGGEVSAEKDRTRADGTSSVTWRLGNGFGVQKVAASVEGASGSPVAFTAIALF